MDTFSYLSGQNLSRLIFAAVLSILLLNTGCTSDKQHIVPFEEGQSLLIYAHSGLQELLEINIPVFEAKFKCTVNVEYAEQPVDLIRRLIEEDEEPQADIIIGVDNGSYYLALENNVVIQYIPEGLSRVDEKYHFDRTGHISPFSYGYLAFIYDSFAIDSPPENFGKLQDGYWRDTILISDPRTSTNGLAFLLWSVAAFGERGYGHLLRSIKNNVLHISETWENSLSMFMAGEAPFFLGYTTTPAYFIEVENSLRYKSFIPEEGAYMYVEGVGIVNGSRSVSLAKNFVEFVVSREFQQHIASKRWLYPVIERGAIPPSYIDIDVPELIVNDRLRANITSGLIESWMERWAQLMID